MANTKQTGHDVSKLASKVLQNPNASNIQKTLAGSALAQAHSTKATSSAVEKVAAKALQGDHYSKTTKSLAGSVVSQSDKKR
jgi:hypothetical protein